MKHMIIDSENEMVFVGKNKSNVKRNHLSMNASVLLALKEAGDNEFTLEDLTTDELQSYDESEVKRLVAMGFEVI